MRVVIALPAGPTGERFESILRARGHDVVRVAKLTKRLATDTAGDVFVCGDRRAIGIAASLDGSPHILAALPKLDDKHVRASLKAGAIDLISTAAGTEELLARVTLRERVHAALDQERPGRLASMESWDGTQELLSEHIAAVFNQVPETTPEDRSGADVVATIRLLCSEDGSTVDIVVGCSAASGVSLLQYLCPGRCASTNLVQDALREVCNNLAGALKQSLADEGVLATLGLPADADSGAYSGAVVSWGLRLRGGELTLGLVPGIGGRRMIPVNELTPGMVLCHDVLNPAGVPFVRGGTALTERTIERLSDILGESFSVSTAVGRLGQEERSDLVESGLVLFDA